MPSRERRAAWSIVALRAALVGLPPFFTAPVPSRSNFAVQRTNVATPLALYVVRWGYHTSIIVQRPPDLLLGTQSEPRARYVEYAWGDRRFFMQSDYRVQSLFATVFLPTEAVAYVDGWEVPPQRLSSAREVYVRILNARDMEKVIAVLEASITRDARGARVVPFAPVRGYDGRFYPAPGDYLWSSDCNRWTVDRLHAVGLARTGRGVIVASQVGARLEGFTRVK